MGGELGAVAAHDLTTRAVGGRVRADAHGGSVADGAAREETGVNTVHARGMATDRPVIVYPPDEAGGRRVRVDGETLGRAFGVQDVTRFLQQAGLQGWDEMDVVRTGLIEWRGGGPEAWTH